MKPDEYRRMFEAEDRQWWYAGQRAIVRALLERALGRHRLAEPGRAEPLSILDAGCGTGGNLAAFAAFGRPVGVDIAAEAMAGCRQRGQRAVRASVLSLPFGAARFDLATSHDVLYHAWVTDDRAAVAEMARVVRPGGHLLVRVPALKLLWGAHDVEVQSRHRYTRGELVRLLESAGLQVRQASYCNSLLFPLLLARRTLDRLLARQGSDVGFLPAPLEVLFRLLLRLEAAFLRRGGRFPIGASVVALARKPR